MYMDTNDDKSNDPSHPEAFCPVLLRSIISGRVDRMRLEWAKNKFNPSAYLGDGSWNWQHMLGADLALTGNAAALEWSRDMLAAQLGDPIDGELFAGSMYKYFGGTETLSSTYEGFRFGSVNALLAEKTLTDDDQLTTLINRYNTALMCLLSLGAVPWWDKDGHVNAHGEPYYTGFTVSPVGERSTMAHAYQSDLGPFLSYILGEGFRSLREDWPMDDVVRAYTDVSAIPTVTRTACRQLISSAGDVGQNLDTVLSTLSGIKLLSRIEWVRYPEGLLVMSGPRVNYNTQKIFYSYADHSTSRMTYGFPWDPGRRRGKGSSRAAGVCEIRDDGKGGGRVVFASADPGFDTSHPIPSSDPLYHVVGDQDGIRRVG